MQLPFALSRFPMKRFLSNLAAIVAVTAIFGAKAFELEKRADMANAIHEKGGAFEHALLEPKS